MPLLAWGHFLLRGRALEYVGLRRIAVFFFWPAGWLTRQRNRATESGRKGDRERENRKSEETERKTQCMQRDVISGSRGRGVKEADITLGRNRCPGIKKAGVRDRWREQEHNIRIRWQPEVIFACFHGCTGLSPM